MAFFGRRSPLEALVMPGVMLACKYNQFRQRRRDAQSKKVTERELTALHHKIVSFFTFQLLHEISQAKIHQKLDFHSSFYSLKMLFDVIDVLTSSFNHNIERIFNYE